ncbi:hypothetical protein ZIOFF_007721 [Zingiber officinale]|uniref:Uncharacterized protein n=1 Tax=Zingiber officinale TaxID=94328 RepID=A0A8J5HUH7_ZINOF|nr:hypothetical protein ZIOFF_007721 [Zingiber officinale]
MSCLRLPVPIAGTGAGVSSSSFISSLTNLFSFVDSRRQLRFPAIAAKARPNKRDKPLQKPLEVAGFEEETIEVDETEGRGEEGFDYFPSSNEFKEEQEEGEMEVDGFLNSSSGYRGRGNEEDYERDPELAEILGSCFDDPKKGQSRVEERIRRKRHKILHAKTGSAKPMKIIFNKFDFSNSYIWFEFYNVPLAKDVNLICDVSLSQAPLESKRLSYDAIQGANVTPATFYNIGDLEIQDNLARIWVDIGTSEPLLLDVLINSLTTISSDYSSFSFLHEKSLSAASIADCNSWGRYFASSFIQCLTNYVGIKQLVFGGSEFENWKDDLTSEDAGYHVHKI